jgi:ABC-type bacteriocin/lantibiotic exporter with double-glycine peptidase domain
MKAWIIHTAAEHRTAILSLIMLQILCGILVSMQPRYYQQLVSLVVDNKGGGIMEKGLPVVGLLAAIFIGASMLQGIGGYIGVRLSSNLLKQLQIRFFEKTARLPLSYFQHQSCGELFTKFNTDIGMAQKFVAAVIPEAVREVVVATCVTAILLYYCPTVLTLTALGIAFIASMAILRLNRTMAAYATAQRDGWSRINRTFDETVRGIDTLKTHHAETYMRRDFLRHTATFRKLCLRAGTVVAVFSPGIELITRLGGLLPLFLAYYLISKGNIELSPFLLFFFYAALLQISISNLVGKLSNVQNELTGIRNLAAFFSESPEPDEPTGLSGRIIRSVPIKITGLTFSYPGGRPLYHNAELEIPEAAITVIHGDSGSGKSTLINLLLKFYPFPTGSIAFGNADLSAISRTELRRKIGVVTQNHFIFQDSLRENLLVAKPDATDSEIHIALEKAQLRNFVKQLPAGLDTVLGYQGKGLSGGEKQRICIARLLLRQSPVMILDEPWANLEVPARDTLADVLNDCKHTATILILTHETASALLVDKVYRLAAPCGKFIEQDHHIVVDNAAS